MYGTQYPQTIPPRSLDSDSSHFLSWLCGSNLTANRNLTVNTGDSDRAMTLNGNPTLNDWFNQAVKTTSAPIFGSGVKIGNLTLADGSIMDSSGAISFGNENLSTSGSMTSDDCIVDGLLRVKIQALGTLSSNTTINFNNGNLATLTLGSSIQIALTGLNASYGTMVHLKVTQGTGGSKLITWTGGNFLFPGSVEPVLSTVAGNIEYISFMWDGSKFILTNVIFALAA